MKKQMLSVLTLMSASVPAFAQYSLAPGMAIIKRVIVDEEPSYFFKVNGDGTRVAYTLFRNQSAMGEQNYMLRIDVPPSQAEPTPIPGPFDPMFNHNYKTMTIPKARGSQYVCAFYSEDEVLKRGRDAVPKFVDPEMRCVYQSVGLLSSDDEGDNFRLIVESSSGFVMRDYREDRASGRIQPLTEVRPLCRGMEIKLPMISKNGRELGAYSLIRNNTVILKINEDGTCSVKDDLKVRAGKISFSYDGKRVAYHVFSNTNPRMVTEFIEVPADDYVSDIFVYNRETGKTQRITKNTRSNSMFPEFTRDGRVIFLDHPHEGTGARASFVILKPN